MNDVSSFFPWGGPGWGSVAPSRLCNGALTALQRGRRCSPTSTPLQPRGGPAAWQRPHFCPFSAIKNLRTFSKMKGRKALNASCLLFFCGRGRFRRSLRMPERALLVIKKQIFMHFGERYFVNKINSSDIWSEEIGNIDKASILYPAQ